MQFVCCVRFEKLSPLSHIRTLARSKSLSLSLSFALSSCRSCSQRALLLCRSLCHSHTYTHAHTLLPLITYQLCRLRGRLMQPARLMQCECFAHTHTHAQPLPTSQCVAAKLCSTTTTTTSAVPVAAAAAGHSSVARAASACLLLPLCARVSVCCLGLQLRWGWLPWPCLSVVLLVVAFVCAHKISSSSSSSNKYKI